LRTMAACASGCTTTQTAAPRNRTAPAAPIARCCLIYLSMPNNQSFVLALREHLHANSHVPSGETGLVSGEAWPCSAPSAPQTARLISSFFALQGMADYETNGVCREFGQALGEAVGGAVAMGLGLLIGIIVIIVLVSICSCIACYYCCCKKKQQVVVVQQAPGIPTAVPAAN